MRTERTLRARGLGGKAHRLVIQAGFSGAFEKAVEDYARNPLRFRFEAASDAYVERVNAQAFAKLRGGDQAFKHMVFEQVRAAQMGPGPFVFIRPDFSGLSTGSNLIVDALARRTSYSLT